MGTLPTASHVQSESPRLSSDRKVAVRSWNHASRVVLAIRSCDPFLRIARARMTTPEAAAVQHTSQTQSGTCDSVTRVVTVVAPDTSVCESSTRYPALVPEKTHAIKMANAINDAPVVICLFVSILSLRQTPELSDRRPAVNTLVTLDHQSASPKPATLELRSGEAVASSELVGRFRTHVNAA